MSESKSPSPEIAKKRQKISDLSEGVEIMEGKRKRRKPANYFVSADSEEEAGDDVSEGGGGESDSDWELDGSRSRGGSGSEDEDTSCTEEEFCEDENEEEDDD
jgi:hypothetical protein